MKHETFNSYEDEFKKRAGVKYDPRSYDQMREVDYQNGLNLARIADSLEKIIELLRCIG